MRLQERPRIRTTFLLSLLISAVLVRLLLAVLSAGSAAAQNVETIPETTQKTVLRPLLSQPAEKEDLTEETAPPSELPAVVNLSFSEADAAGIRIAGQCSYSVDPFAALQDNWRSGQEKAAILIVHTHGTEAYTASEGWEYTGSEECRSTDPAFSVVRVGTELQEALEAQGIEAYHDLDMHDLNSFSGAYGESRQAVLEAISAHPEIAIVIDLHRDAAENPDGSAFAPTLIVDGVSYAQLMLVVGTDQGGLEHPQWRQNLCCAMQLQALLNRSMPGLCRDLDLRTERFNQDLLPGSILIEVGASGNTMPQVLRTAQALADALAQMLKAC